MALRHTVRLHSTTPLASTVHQIAAVQVLRAVAVTLVAWLHAGFPFWVRSEYHLPDFGIFGVDLFFVISGFIIALVAMRNPGPPGGTVAWRFLVRRLIRIYPIYWMFALLALAVYLHRHMASPRELFSLLLLPVPGAPMILGVAWTLMFEIWFYLAMTAVLLLSVRYAVHLSTALFVVAIVVGRLLGIRGGAFGVLLSPMSLEFVLGSLVALAFTRFNVRPRSGKVLLTTGIAIAFFLRNHTGYVAQDVRDILAGHDVLARVATWGIAAALILAGAVFWSPRMQSKTGRAAVVVGSASYSAYLASPLVLDFTLRYLFRAFPPKLPVSIAWTLTYQVCCVLSVLSFGWLTYQFVEWPLVRALQSRASTRARKATSGVRARLFPVSEALPSE